MATADIKKLVRDSALVIRTYTSAMSSATLVGTLATGIAEWASLSTYASTMTTGDINLFVPFKEGDKLGFMVGWGSTNVATATTQVNLVLKAGSGPRASWRRDLGDYTLALGDGTTGPFIRSWMIGPFEDARFGIVCDASSAAVGVAKGQKYAHLQLRCGPNSTLAGDGSASSGTHIAASVIPFQWPEVNYAT